MPAPIRKRPTQPFDEFDTLIDLLSEYTDKLNALALSPPVIVPKGKIGPQGILPRLKPIAEDLARFASQQIEFGGLEPLNRLELQLRLAEFEAALEGASRTR